MDFNLDLVMPTNPTVDFFIEHEFEIISYCMRIQPNTNGLTKKEVQSTRFEGMNMVAKKHEFGRFRHLCKTCFQDFATCNGDPMFSDKKGSDNVCYCEQYNGSISPEIVSKGLSE